MPGSALLMKVRIRFGWCGPRRPYVAAGTVVEVSAEEGEHLISTNQADPVGKRETATVKAPEQAAVTEAPKPKTPFLKGKRKKEA